MGIEAAIFVVKTFLTDTRVAITASIFSILLFIAYLYFFHKKPLKNHKENFENNLNSLKENYRLEIDLIKGQLDHKCMEILLKNSQCENLEKDVHILNMDINIIKDKHDFLFMSYNNLNSENTMLKNENERLKNEINNLKNNGGSNV